MRKRIVAGIIVAFILAFVFTFSNINLAFVNTVKDFIVPIIGRSINSLDELRLVDHTVEIIWLNEKDGSSWVIDLTTYRTIRLIATSIIETLEVGICLATFLLVSQFDKLPFLSKHYAAVKRDN